MIVNNDFLKRLRSAFDLNIYEVKIWTALLSKGIATAGELSDISDVPRSRSYDVLESLEKRGFVIMKLGKPIRYIAVQPDEIMKRVKKSILVDSESKISSLDKVESTEFFKELSLLYKNGINHIDPTTISGSIRGRNNIYDHVESMLGNAKSSIVIVTSSEGLKRKYEQLGATLKKLASKGVKVKIAATINNDNMKIAKQFTEFADVRKVNDINARFILVDGKEMTFMINDDKEIHESYDVGIWVKSPFFSSAFDSMFASNWAKLEKI